MKQHTPPREPLFTGPEIATVLAFVTPLGLTVERRTAGALDAPSRTLRLMSGARTICTLAVTTAWHSYSVGARFSGFRAEGSFIPKSGTQRYGDGKKRRQDLGELLEVIKPYLRTETPFELACEATRAVLHRTWDWDITDRAAMTSSHDYLRALVVDAADLDRVIPTHLIEAAMQIRSETLAEAACSACTEMWTHWDYQQPGSPNLAEAA